MIASLRGVVAQKTLDRIVVDVGGVGYQLWLSTQTVAELPGEGEQVRLLCHTHVREDALQLFGFVHDRERQAFELLIGVSGVGPRLALTILSGMVVDDLVLAIAEGDHRRLQSIPGVGKRTAERLVVELRDRFGKLASAKPSDGGAALDPRGDVLEALVNLGYRRNVAERAVKQVEERQSADLRALSAEQVLRDALTAISEL